MAKAHDEWIVLPHGPLQRLTDNLWCVEGSLPKMQLKRVMSVARFDDGRLLIHNAIAVNPDVMAAIEGWGEPAFLVVPNGWHRLDAKVFRRRYPQLRVLCPAGATARVSEVVPVQGSYDDLPADDAVQLEHFDGVGRREGLLQVKSAEQGTTLVFNDLVFNLPHLPGVLGLILRLMGSTGGPRITRLSRLLMIKDRQALRAHLERLATISDLRRIVIMHGSIIDEQAATVLRAIAATL